MRVSASVTSISWIPSGAIDALPRGAFRLGGTLHDDPPPDLLADLESVRTTTGFQHANELRAWIEVEDGRIVGHGFDGHGYGGGLDLALTPDDLAVPAVELPTLQPEPEVQDGAVRFVQSAGGPTSVPAPLTVPGRPLTRLGAVFSWTTLALTIRADGSSAHELVGASPFPRHWIYDSAGRLVEKTGVLDEKGWYRALAAESTPWGGSDSQAVTTAVESAFERTLSAGILGGDWVARPWTLKPGEELVRQGDRPGEVVGLVFLVVDGVLAAEVDGEVVAEIGPGAIVGERAFVEGGPAAARTATLRATTKTKVVGVPAGELGRDTLATLAASRRRMER